MSDQDEIVLDCHCLESPPKQHKPSPNPDTHVNVCVLYPYVYEPLCKGVEGDYSRAFTLSGQRDGSASSLAPPIPDHSPGISELLSHTESTALNCPSTEPKFSEPLNFTAPFFPPLTILIHPFGKFLLLLPSSLSAVDF